MSTVTIEYAIPTGSRYYIPARKFLPGRLLIAIPLAVVFACACGLLYSVISWKSKNFYIRLGLVFGGAIAIALIAMSVVALCRVHHRVVAVLIGTIVGLVGLAASWLEWVQSVLASAGADVSLFRLAARPVPLFRLIKAFGQTGVWTWEGSRLRGVPLFICWLIEAVVFVGFSVLAGGSTTVSGYVCSTCHRKCQQTHGLGRYDGADTAGVSENIEAGNFDHLLQLGKVKHEDNPELILELHGCNCGATNILNVNRIQWEMNSQGRLQVKSRPVVAGLLLSLDQVDAVKSLKSRLQQASPPEATAEIAGESDSVLPGA